MYQTISSHVWLVCIIHLHVSHGGSTILQSQLLSIMTSFRPPSPPSSLTREATRVAAGKPPAPVPFHIRLSLPLQVESLPLQCSAVSAVEAVMIATLLRSNTHTRCEGWFALSHILSVVWRLVVTHFLPPVQLYCFYTHNLHSNLTLPIENMPAVGLLSAATAIWGLWVLEPLPNVYGSILGSLFWVPCSSFRKLRA